MKVVKQVNTVNEFRKFLEEFEVPESVIDHECETFNRYVQNQAQLPAKVELEKSLYKEVTIIPFILKKKSYKWSLEVRFADGRDFRWSRIPV